MEVAFFPQAQDPAVDGGGADLGPAGEVVGVDVLLDVVGALGLFQDDA